MWLRRDARILRDRGTVCAMYVCAECGQSYPAAGVCSADGQALVLATDPLLGTTLGRHRVACVIGEGGMGRVYLAVQPEIGGRVAIKVLSSHDQELIERFFAEARAVNLIRNEHIVDVIDLARLPDGRPYIVMEYVDGQTLGDAVRAGPAPIGAVTSLMIEVLSALGAAHAVGIVHRDLKPDNIAITAGGHAKVLDFGIAKLAPALHGSRAARTHSGVAVGTPEYMSPEQVMGAVVDARTDLYAAGLVLFEAFTGRRPFGGTSDFEIMRAQVDDVPPSPRELRAELPVELEAVIFQAIAKRPEDRFQSAAAMANALVHGMSILTVEQRQPFTPRARIAKLSRPQQLPETVDQRTPRTPATATVRDDDPSATVSERPGSRREARPAARAPRWWLLGASVAVAATIAGVIAMRSHTPDAIPAHRDPVVALAPADALRVAVDAAIVVQAAAADASAIMKALIVDAAPVDRHRAPKATRDDVIGEDPFGSPPAQQPPAASITSSSVTSITRSPDYDPTRFDPIAYLPSATAKARAILSDAGLIQFDFDVGADGRADLTRSGRYIFQSPSQQGECMVRIDVESTEVKVRALKASDCGRKMPPTGAPSCTIVGLWELAIRAGAQRGFPASVSWHDRHWSFDIHAPSADHFSQTFEDRCSSELVRTSEAGDPEVSRKRPDYDVQHFDPSAYLAKAAALVRARAPGATVTSIKFEHVGADGRVDLTKFSQFHAFVFGVAHPIGNACGFWVATERNDLSLGAIDAIRGACDPLPRPPRCTFAQIWKRAAADGADTSRDAKVFWDNGTWELIQNGTPNFDHKLDDQCP